jgi:S-formylglutathione hydrolase FrmB
MVIKGQLQTTLLPAQTVPYSVVLPTTRKRTLLWLHGYQERVDHLLAHPLFEQLAEAHQIAIVFPDVPDTYYLNQSWNRCYTEDFIIKEFIPYITEKYQLPAHGGSMFLAGISMGGFGSLLLGAHHPDLFRKIICISGAFILDDLIIGNPEIVGSASNIHHFRNLFGDIPTLADDGMRNPLYAIENMDSKQSFPPVFLSCGTEDLLFKRNIRLHRRLQELGIDVNWYEAAGNHNWDFFQQAILSAFGWLGTDSAG